MLAKTDTVNPNTGKILPDNEATSTHVEFALSIDRLTVCFNEPNKENVLATVQEIWDGNKHGIFPIGANVGKKGFYKACVSLPFPGKTPGSKAKAFFQAGPHLPGHPSYRLDFNPSKFSSSDLQILGALLNGMMDPTPAEFFNNGKITRIDIALDLRGMTTDALILRSKRKKKHGCFSSANGTPETVYLGTPRSARLVGYTKEFDGETTFRIESRLKPKCPGIALTVLSNPFREVQLFSAESLSGVLPAVPCQLLCDCIRIRGVSGAMKLLPKVGRGKLKSIVNNKALSVLPDPETVWLQWPAALTKTGLFKPPLTSST
jgi:hypothetical protein